MSLIIFGVISSHASYVIYEFSFISNEDPFADPFLLSNASVYPLLFHFTVMIKEVGQFTAPIDPIRYNEIDTRE